MIMEIKLGILAGLLLTLIALSCSGEQPIVPRREANWGTAETYITFDKHYCRRGIRVKGYDKDHFSLPARPRADGPRGDGPDADGPGGY